MLPPDMHPDAAKLRTHDIEMTSSFFMTPCHYWAFDGENAPEMTELFLKVSPLLIL